MRVASRLPYETEMHLAFVTAQDVIVKCNTYYLQCICMDREGIQAMQKVEACSSSQC